MYTGEHGPTPSTVFGEVKPLFDGDVVTSEDETVSLRVLHTPGHTPEHACFVLEQEEALFAGDCVLGGSSAVFEDLHAYMKSLRRLLSEAESMTNGSNTRIFPGHGPLIEDGAAAVRQYISHRESREAQIVNALSSRRFGLSVLSLVRIVYPEVSWKLYLAAASNVSAVLNALQKDGRASSHAWLPFTLPGFRSIFRLLFTSWRLK